jgi:hypothetical protein
LPFVLVYFQGITNDKPNDYINSSWEISYFILFAISTISFWWLFILMLRLHRFEFDRNKTWLVMFYLGIIITVLVDYFLSKYKYNLENNDDFGKGLKGLDDMCFNSKVIWLIPIKNFKDNLGLNSIMFAGIILYLKKDEDILQGINKLDYLLKVSVFQIYKNKEKQNLKEES